MPVDPFGGYNFLVRLVDSGSELTSRQASIEGSPSAGFSECSGLEATLEVEDYREGGNNGTVLKFPTRVTWTSLRLRRGVTFDDRLWLWHHGFVEGTGRRQDGLIALHNDLHEVVKIWTFTRGLPTKWTGPSLDAAKAGVAVEELTIVHEGLALLPVQGG